MSNWLAIGLVALGSLAIWAGWSGNYAKLQTLWGLSPSTVTASKGN
jgi:hypothetical protein